MHPYNNLRRKLYHSVDTLSLHSNAGRTAGSCCTYWHLLVEHTATNESPFLEIFGENVTTKLAALVALPRYILLVHFNGLLIDRERVSVIEQAPGNKTTGHDRSAIGASAFRLTVFNQVCSVLGPQLFVTSTLDVPGNIT